MEYIICIFFKLYFVDICHVLYNVCLEKGSDQLIVTLFTLNIYPSVHKIS